MPVEHDFGSGTAGAHWDEDRFNAELMTGFIESAGVPMPISRMTIGSLQDMGYAVNYAAADAYSLPGGATLGNSGNNRLDGTTAAIASAATNVLTGNGRSAADDDHRRRGRGRHRAVFRRSRQLLASRISARAS